MRHAKPEVQDWWDSALHFCGASLTNGCGIISWTLQIDVRSETLSIADTMNGVVHPVLKFAPIGHEHLFTVVPRVFVPRVPLDVLEELARTASDEAKKSVDVVL